MAKMMPIKNLVVRRKSLYKAFDDCEQGRCTQSKGPVEIMPLQDEQGKFQLIDGHHRLVEYLVNQKHLTNGHKIPVKVVDEQWARDYYAITPKEDRWEYSDSLKYGNLEDLADEEIIDDLSELLKQSKSLKEDKPMPLQELLLFIESSEQKIPSAEEIINSGICDDDNGGYFYHATPVRNLKNILKKGIQPNPGEQSSFLNLNKWSKGKIFVSADYNNAKMWQEMLYDIFEEGIAILEIDLTDSQIKMLKLDKVSYEEDDPCSFYLTVPVRPNQIQIIDNGENI